MQGLLGTCRRHTLNKSFNLFDSKTTYLVGLSACVLPKFEYVCFSSLEISLGIISCGFLLECPSCFVRNYNFLTLFNINRESELYTEFNFHKQGQFQL